MKKMFLALLLVSSFTFNSCKQEIKTESSETITDNNKINKPEELSSEQLEMKSFYESKGFTFDKEKSIDQYLYEKRILESKVFIDNNFCELYHLYLNKSGSDLKSFLKKYEIKGESIDNFFAFNGASLCKDYVKKAVAKKNNKFEIDYSLPIVNPCAVSINFIKNELQNPNTIDYSSFDCSKENDGNLYTVLRKISAKNLMGVEKQYIFKLKIAYLGGNENEFSNWKLITVQSEEYK